MKAIQTEYKGYKFRSRLEARWAVFFEELGLDWDYEVEGYEFKDGTRYLPDFLIKTNDDIPKKWYVEVKGNLDDAVGIKKAKRLDNAPPGHVLGCLIVSGLHYTMIVDDGFGEPPYYNGPALFAQHLGVSMNRFNQAIKKGKQARFEFGETP